MEGGRERGEGEEISTAKMQRGECGGERCKLLVEGGSKTKRSEGGREVVHRVVESISKNKLFEGGRE